MLFLLKIKLLKNSNCCYFLITYDKTKSDETQNRTGASVSGMKRKPC